MVMEVAPSPQCVGREFVRQYYTLLNKAPTHVHRFYNNNSSFVHGGLEVFNREGNPAVGQKQIHQCIQQLNFRDCHAKITQVDSQATLGNGVVVQVTGELSNGGQPMRRFTQTFVLGAQSPKQYYVHNDIFRYQDLVFGDDDPDQESHHYEPEDEEPEHPQQSEHPQVQQQQESTYYPSAPPMPTVNGTSHAEHVAEPTPVQASLPSSQPPAVTPSFNDIISHHVQQQPPPMQPPPPQAVPVYGAVTAPEPSLEPEQPEPVDLEPEDITPPPMDQDPPLIQDNVSSNEPKTYASTLVKSGGGVANFNTSPSAPAKSPPSPPPPMTRLETRNNEINMGVARGGGGLRPLRGSGSAGRGGVGRGMENRPPRQSLSEDSRDYGGRDDLGSDGDRRRSVNSQTQYADDHQLFLGNLPLNASENDLRDLFKTFGPIVDLRIMSKSNMKGQNGNKVPNYGFIIFERVETVQAVLSARPIYFPGENAVKLNVEEKKTKPRTDGGGRGGMRGGLSRGGQRGGFSRGGAGMRPGAGFTQRGGPR